MPEPDQEPTDPQALRVLLIGPRGVGKSALLGALLQAGETQGAKLGAEVIDLGGQLTHLRDYAFTNTPLERSHSEVVSFLIRLRPWRINSRPVMPALNVLLLDCEGRAAESVLKHPAELADPSPKGTVAKEVAASDAIVLLVDAAADDAELLAAFRDFTAFIVTIETGKTFARQVGGFPVFITLTQCDRLVRPHDDRARWEERVAARKRYVQARFADYLDESPAVEGVHYLAFGSIDLDVAAVATRLPTLAGEPGPANEPYSVAELFRDCFTAADEHRTRIAASDRQLSWTVRAVGTALATLVAGLAAILFLQPSPGDPDLADRIRAYEQTEPNAAVRLAEKALPPSRRTLTEFQSDSGFYALPDDLREFVSGRLKEIDDYIAYRQKLTAIASPAEARNREELNRIEAALTQELALPPEYAWSETEAAKLRDKYLHDIPLIRDAEVRWHDWYRDLIRRTTTLALVKSFGGNWRESVNTLFADAGKLPFRLNEPIPGSESVAQARGGAVEYRVPYEFDRVYQARQDWEFAKDRLNHLRDLADMLGLTSGPGRPAALFDLPEPSPMLDVANLPAARLAALKSLFPHEPEGFPDWELRNFPEPGRTELTIAVKRSFEAGLRSVRGLVRKQLGSPSGPRDTPAGWQTIAASLDGPVYRDWGRLLHLLAKLIDPRAPDPVAELKNFLLQKEPFTLDFKGFDLAIPVDLRERDVIPAGPLTITLTSPGTAPVQKTFRWPNREGDKTRKDGAVVYRFIPDGDTRFTYRPGDQMSAEVECKAGMLAFKLIWSVGGTQTFQFERLNREPLLIQGLGPPERGAGVRLIPIEGAVVPKLPVLLPD